MPGKMKNEVRTVEKCKVRGVNRNRKLCGLEHVS